MSALRQTVATVGVVALVCLWAAMPSSVEAASTVEVFAPAGNTCMGGVATINDPVVVSCPGGLCVLDFVAAGCPDVVINAELKTDGTSACTLRLEVNTLVVEVTGSIIHPVVNAGARPGRVEVLAAANSPTDAIIIRGTIDVDGSGGLGPPPASAGNPFGPSILLQAGTRPDNDPNSTGGNIILDPGSRLEARATITNATVGGRIDIISGNGKVSVLAGAVVKVSSTAPGGSHIQIEACNDIEISGELDADSPQNGTEIHLFTRENIILDDATLTAELTSSGTIQAGSPNEHEITLEARNDILITNGTLINTRRAGNNSLLPGIGAIYALSQQGNIVCDASELLANGPGAGSNGGPVTLLAAGNITNQDCSIEASGNVVSGQGGTILEQAGGDILGNAMMEALPNGSIDLKAGGVVTKVCDCDPVETGMPGVPFDPTNPLIISREGKFTEVLISCLNGCGSCMNVCVQPTPCDCSAPTVICTGGPCAGTMGDDVILGTAGVDLIDATQGGNDTICTGAGADTINAGPGNDCIDAGGGNNSINAGGGDNDVTSGDELDVINTGNGADVINAGGGNNLVTSFDRRFAGGGDDEITTLDGGDTINAGPGNNCIDSGDTVDKITAGGGDDTVDCGDPNPGDIFNLDGGVDVIMNCP